MTDEWTYTEEKVDPDDILIPAKERNVYREALREIVGLQHIEWYAHPWNFDKRVRRIARRALAQFEEKK